MKTPNEWIELLSVLDRQSAILRIMEMSAREFQELSVTLAIRAFGRRDAALAILEAIREQAQDA
jgi:hypothetical protein